jgi:4-oxalocrotonate tautomerase
MPLVRIDISKTASRERVRDVGNAVYNAMIAVANVPEYDRFQVDPKRATSASTRRRS